MSTIADSIKQLHEELPEEVTLVAVSKFHPVEALKEAYEAGQRVFGESKAQEMAAKHEAMPEEDIQWHFIGHLQTNKVKYIIPFVNLIHSVDSYKLLEEINKQAFRQGRVVDCLLQVHIAMEETKFGFTPEECEALLADSEWRQLTNIRVCGLMGMASNVENEEQVRGEFKTLHNLFVKLQNGVMEGKPSFCKLSMGMSHDYKWAIEEGSTMVRVGTAIFGNRA